MVYRAKEVRSGRRVILKSYDSRTLSSSSRRQALERQVLTLRAAQAAAGAGSSGLVALERVVENADGTYLVVQACNGEQGSSRERRAWSVGGSVRMPHGSGACWLV